MNFSRGTIKIILALQCCDSIESLQELSSVENLHNKKFTASKAKIAYE